MLHDTNRIYSLRKFDNSSTNMDLQSHSSKTMPGLTLLALHRHFCNSTTLIFCHGHPNRRDLNPIEHIWDELDRRVRSRPNQPATLADLRIALRTEWNRMPQGVFAQTILSMRRRVGAVVNARGGHTRY